MKHKTLVLRSINEHSTEKNDFCSQILQSNEFVDSEKLGVKVNDNLLEDY